MAETKDLAKRLTRQLAAKGNKDAKSMAYGILNKRGDAKGSMLTAKGKAREALGAGGRAKDRASKATGKPASSFKYNAKTNSTREK
jgi:hypothetical protein